MPQMGPKIGRLNHIAPKSFLTWYNYCQQTRKILLRKVTFWPFSKWLGTFISSSKQGPIFRFPKLYFKNNHPTSSCARWSPLIKTCKTHNPKTYLQPNHIFERYRPHLEKRDVPFVIKIDIIVAWIYPMSHFSAAIGELNPQRSPSAAIVILLSQRGSRLQRERELLLPFEALSKIAFWGETWLRSTTEGEIASQTFY